MTIHIAQSPRSDVGERRRWSVGGMIAIVLLLAAAMGLATAAVKTAIHLHGSTTADASQEPAGLIVQATDGTNVMVWAERDGQPGRLLPRQCELPPGKVALRITRQIGADQTRSDIVRLTLKPGCRHFVHVGDEGIAAHAYQDSREFSFDSGFPAPGVLCFDPNTGNLTTHDSGAEAGQLSLTAWQELVFTGAAPTISGRDHALIVVNPYPQAIDCRVIADAWEHEIGIVGPACRVIALGACKHVRVVCNLSEDGALVEDRTLDLPATGIPMYTIGGRTAYRWTMQTADAGVPTPPLPRGWLATLPPETRVQLSADPSADQRLLTLQQWHGAEVGLAPLAVVPLANVQTAPPAPTSVRGDFRLARIPSKPVSCVVTDGTSIVGVCDGIACDLSTGNPLHLPGDAPVVSAAWGPFGLVLVTSDGSICRVQDRKLVAIGMIDDPTAQPVPAVADQPSLWMWGGMADFMRLQTIGGPPGEIFAVSGITAFSPAGEALLVASGRRVNRLNRADDGHRWLVQPAVILPDNDRDPIVGVADVGGRLFFSTSDSVFTVEGDLVLPVADGIGGKLLAYRDGVLVHDAATGRVMSLSPVAAPVSAEARP